MALNAIVAAADRAGWQQAVVLGTPPGEPAPSVGGLAADRIKPLVFESERLPYPIPGMSDVMPYASSRFSAMTSEQISSYRSAWRDHLAAVIEQFQPRVIHCHHVWIVSSLVKDITRSIPVVTHCHGTGIRQLSLCPKLAPQVRSGCSRNDAFLLLHQGHSDSLRAELTVGAERMSIIGSGFRDDIYHDRGRSPSPGLVVTYAGKLSQAKGLPWLLQATERLANRFPELELHVAGSGSGAEADAIRDQMAAAKQVTFHGQLPPEQLADLMRRSSLFVLPSFYEGLPLVLLEAAACGCRLVATALPGIQDQLRPALGERLSLVPLPRVENMDRPVQEDLPRFVQHLTRAIESSLTQDQQSPAGERLTGMTWDSVFAKIETVWRRLIQSTAADEASRPATSRRR